MSTTSDLAASLARVELFSGLSRKELGVVAGACRSHSFSEGETIVSAGSTTQRFYLIESGEVEVVAQGTVVARLGPGQYFGEMAVIDKAERSADVRAIGPVVAHSLAPFAFRPLLHENPEICYKLLVTMCQRVRELEAQPGQRTEPSAS